MDVVRRLRKAGYLAYWAGGCVRDQLLGREPKDYDVATDAKPDEIRTLFGRGRTLALGASFGVITVIGPPGAGQIEVATFRDDVGYSDGRHPDHVHFSTAEMDASRRDFTINGLFFDPIGQEVIDYVGGREDLRLRRIRAIGDPVKRFTEDKLRMLRAVRFSAGFDFELDPATWGAICRMSAQITVVSWERISAEIARFGRPAPNGRCPFARRHGPGSSDSARAVRRERGGAALEISRRSSKSSAAGRAGDFPGTGGPPFLAATAETAGRSAGVGADKPRDQSGGLAA